MVEGLVRLSQIESAKDASEHRVGEFVQRSVFPEVYRDHSLSLALERMGSAGVDSLPVVSRADRFKLEGIITLPDILSAYGLGTKARKISTNRESEGF
jgi:CBS domain-containing protein